MDTGREEQGEGDTMSQTETVAKQEKGRSRGRIDSSFLSP